MWLESNPMKPETLTRINPYSISWLELEMLIPCIHLYMGCKLSRHCIMTSSNENIFCITGPLWWESTGQQWIPLIKRSVTYSYDVFFDLHLFSWINNRDVSNCDVIVFIMTSLSWYLEMSQHCQAISMHIADYKVEWIFFQYFWVFSVFLILVAIQNIL